MRCPEYWHFTPNQGGYNIHGYLIYYFIYNFYSDLTIQPSKTESTLLRGRLNVTRLMPTPSCYLRSSLGKLLTLKQNRAWLLPWMLNMANKRPLRSFTFESIKPIFWSRNVPHMEEDTNFKALIVQNLNLKLNHYLGLTMTNQQLHALLMNA